MKKLIIAVFAVAFAAVAQAASVNWASGTLYTAAGATGGWSSTTAQSAGAIITMNLYLVDATTYSEVAALDQKGIYDWASSKTADYTAKNVSTTSAVIGAATISVKDTLAASTTYYSIITAEYADATYGDMYMAAAKTVTTGSSGAGSVANIFGGTASAGGVRDWQAAAVPEPTSGLLLLLGMAGLALRRKQA